MPGPNRGTLRLAVIALLLGSLLVSVAAFAQSPYAPNVTASKTNTVPVSGGSGSVDNTGTTGVKVNFTGLAGVTSAAVTTQSLNAPSTGVGTFSTSGTPVYFDVKVVLPAGTTAPAGAKVTVCFTDPSVTSSDTLNYWSGSDWVSATNVVISGSQICGTVPLSALTGTNFAVAPAATPSIFANIYLWILVVVIIIVIGVAIWAMRRKKA